MSGRVASPGSELLEALLVVGIVGIMVGSGLQAGAECTRLDSQSLRLDAAGGPPRSRSPGCTGGNAKEGHCVWVELGERRGVARDCTFLDGLYLV